MIAIACLVISLALPKTAKILVPVAAICFVASAFIILVDGICEFADSSRPWAYGINLIAVSLIIIGLVFGLIRYAFLLKPDFGKNKPASKAPQTTE
jgi:divalent metal cation (Fe/Co/Zn/Cd) transporter